MLQNIPLSQSRIAQVTLYGSDNKVTQNHHPLFGYISSIQISISGFQYKVHMIRRVPIIGSTDILATSKLIFTTSAISKTSLRELL